MTSFLLLVSVICGSLMVDAFQSSLEGHDDRDGVHWALIVAGSNGWYNYRHQVSLLVLLFISDYISVM